MSDRVGEALQVLVGPLQANAVLLYLLYLLYQARVQRPDAPFCLDLAGGIGQQHQASCELISGVMNRADVCVNPEVAACTGRERDAQWKRLAVTVPELGEQDSPMPG